MMKINIGTLRFIELFDESDKDKNRKYEAYIRSFKLNEELGENFLVIASINGMEPVFKMNKDNREMIAVHDSVKNKLIVIAADRKQFDEIILEISKIWKDYRNQMFLPRNDQTISLYKGFIKKMIKKKNIDYSYWIDFAFKELDIRYEV